MDIIKYVLDISYIHRGSYIEREFVVAALKRIREGAEVSDRFSYGDRQPTLQAIYLIAAQIEEERRPKAA